MIMNSLVISKVVSYLVMIDNDDICVDGIQLSYINEKKPLEFEHSLKSNNSLLFLHTLNLLN